MFDLLSTYGMLDYQYWMWIAATLFVITVLRDIVRERSWTEGY
jgi:hypothetical protein